jgi:hypothetical protein
MLPQNATVGNGNPGLADIEDGNVTLNSRANALHPARIQNP